MNNRRRPQIRDGNDGYDRATGWIAGARRVDSPNFDARPAGIAVDLVVIHGISLPAGEFGGGHIDRLFTNTLDPGAHPSFAALRNLRVSAHLLLDRAGSLTQYVALTDRAWHAGASSYCGRPSCNDYAIGVELEGCDDIPYTKAQYAALGALLTLLRNGFPGISGRRVVGHCDVAPERKTDPGPAFDWSRIGSMLEGE
jgi:AmpD protein